MKISTEKETHDEKKKSTVKLERLSLDQFMGFNTLDHDTGFMVDKVEESIVLSVSQDASSSSH